MKKGVLDHVLTNTGEWLLIATRWLQEPAFSSGSNKTGLGKVEF